MGRSLQKRPFWAIAIWGERWASIARCTTLASAEDPRTACERKGMASLRMLRHIVDHTQATTCDQIGRENCDECLGGRLAALQPTEGSWCVWTVQYKASPQGACRSQNDYTTFLDRINEIAISSDDYPVVSAAANASSSSAQIFSEPLPSCDLRQSNCKHSACSRVTARYTGHGETIPAGIVALAGVLCIALFFLLVCIYSRYRNTRQSSHETEGSVTLDKSSEGSATASESSAIEGETEGSAVADDKTVQVDIPAEATTQDGGVEH